MTDTKPKSLREIWTDGSKWRVIREGAHLSGMEAKPGYHQGWRRDLAVGDILTCRGVQWGWGSDPGMEVRFEAPDIPPGVSHVTVRPALWEFMSVSPQPGYLELVPPRVEGYLVLVPNYWGWGETVLEARDKARIASFHSVSVARGNRAVYRLPIGALDARVDDMGNIHWDWAEDAPDRTATGEWIEEPRR